MQTQETVEQDTNADTGTNVDTDNKSETDEGADTDSNDTNDDTSPNPGANSITPAGDTKPSTGTTQPSSTDNTNTTTDDTLDTTDEDAKKDIVLQSADGAETADDTPIQPVEETTSNGITYPIMVYFAVLENFNDSWTVKFNAQKVENTENWVAKKDMALQSELYDGRKVFGVELNQDECPRNG